MRRMQGSRKVLVVDDQRDGADSLSTLLNLLGAEARPAYDAAGAFRLLSAFHPAVAILDIQMPGLAGDELAKLIQAAPAGREVRLIAVTGNDDASTRRRIDSAGFDHSFVKPLDLEVLLAAIEGSTPRRRLTRCGSRD